MRASKIVVNTEGGEGLGSWMMVLRDEEENEEVRRVMNLLLSVISIIDDGEDNGPNTKVD